MGGVRAAGRLLGTGPKLVGCRRRRAHCARSGRPRERPVRRRLAAFTFGPGCNEWRAALAVIEGNLIVMFFYAKQDARTAVIVMLALLILSNVWANVRAFALGDALTPDLASLSYAVIGIVLSASIDRKSVV